MQLSDLNKISDYLWEIPKTFRGDMRTSVRIYASEEMLKSILEDRSLEQIVNVATMPGIVGDALAMPDVHEGYGFPVGGVAAFDVEGGVISPGGIGYDINCGVRLVCSSLDKDFVESRKEELGYALFREIPSGVGKGGDIVLDDKKLDSVLLNGAKELVKMGFATEDDLEHIESRGVLENANPEAVSGRAKKRGSGQMGTLGAGNHFVEVQYVDEIYDSVSAEKMGIRMNQVVVMVHTGSRGLGHQVATDYIRKMMSAMSKYNISMPDRELACVPFQSEEGQEYFNAMAAAANFAWANRQTITYHIRNAWQNTFLQDAGEMKLVYDVAHNMAKLEEHLVNGRKQQVVVHRKGATRAFPGQPVLIPGSMGTASYLLEGLEESMNQSFGTVCHGAGRRMSRTAARKKVSGYELKMQLAEKGIIIMSESLKGLAEEAPIAYKDVDNVVDVVHQVGIAKKVARMRPMIVVKG